MKNNILYFFYSSIIFLFSVTVLMAGKSVQVIHQVQHGENLIQIADKYNVSIHDIVNWNKIRNKNHIYKKQKLKIYIFKYKKPQIFDIKNPHKFYPPLKQAKIIKNFNKYGDRKLYGVIYSSSKYDTLYASSSGKVIDIGYMRGYGKYIIIDHGAGWLSMYANLNTISISKGSEVTYSEAIATITSNQLFFLLSYKGIPINPVFHISIPNIGEFG